MSISAAPVTVAPVTVAPATVAPVTVTELQAALRAAWAGQFAAGSMYWSTPAFPTGRDSMRSSHPSLLTARA